MYDLFILNVRNYTVQRWAMYRPFRHAAVTSHKLLSIPFKSLGRRILI